VSQSISTGVAVKVGVGVPNAESSVAGAEAAHPVRNRIAASPVKFLAPVSAPPKFLMLRPYRHRDVDATALTSLC